MAAAALLRGSVAKDGRLVPGERILVGSAAFDGDSATRLGRIAGTAMAEQGRSFAEGAPDPIATTAVDIVIANWNSGAPLRDCLAALDRSPEAQRVNVIVVDNASTDQSATALALDRARLHVAHDTINRGFAVACNEGARLGAAPYLLFLNPDVRIV